MADEERKIFIDEDWKARAQREKEEARRLAEAEKEKASQPRAEAQTPPAGSGVAPGGAEADELAGDEGPSFLALVSSLATQTMFALGVLVPRGSQQVYVNLDEARFTLDLLAILREKTKGNLTPEEDGQLTATLAELQEVYVARVQQAQEHAMRQAGVDPRNLKGGPPA